MLRQVIRFFIFSLVLSAAGALAAAESSPAHRQVTDLAGNVVTIPREINRIACMDVLCYQKLLMLGAIDKAVMIYRTDAPWMTITNPASTNIVKIAGEPNMEGLLLRKVDVAFFAYDIRKTAKKLAAIGIPGVVSQAWRSGLQS